MWDPKTWDDITAAIGTVEEGQHIDLKLGDSLKHPNEVAKDVVAMSVQGGVIAYGIDEEDEVATAAPGLAFAGQQNRIHQILSSHIEPPIGVTVRAIENAQDSGKGVLVIVVPPSVNAPHYCRGRFPVRRGTTTDVLTEREIADLYQRRAAISNEQADGSPARFTPPAWFVSNEVDMTDVGFMQVQVSPVGPTRLEYRLSNQLHEAARVAEARVASLLGDAPPIPGSFSTWRPYEARGWSSERRPFKGDWHLSNATCDATLLYAQGFSIQLTLPLLYQGVRHIWERVWSANLVGSLALAGQFYENNSSVSLARAEVNIYGIGEASTGPAQSRFSEGPYKVPPYQERAVLPVAELATMPQLGAALLLDRFLAAIYPHGPDLHRLLGIDDEAKGPPAV